MEADWLEQVGHGCWLVRAEVHSLFGPRATAYDFWSTRFF